MDQLRGFAINSAPEKFDLQRGLPSGFLEFFVPLHQRFTPRQRELIAKRKRVRELLRPKSTSATSGRGAVKA